MTALSNPATLTFGEIAIVGAGLAGALSLLFAAVARALRISWPWWFATGFAACMLAYVQAATAVANDVALLRVNTVTFAVGYALLTQGLWRYSAARALRVRDAHQMATLGLLLAMAVAVLVLPIGRLALQVCACVVWLSWATRCLRTARASDDRSFVIIAAACLVYPALTIAAVLTLLPPTISRIFGPVPLMTFGLSLLVTSLLRSQRIESEARAVAENALRERTRAESELRLLNASLEQRIEERTAELRETIDGLESFNRSVSHDLRGPLSGIAGVADIARTRVKQGDHAAALRMIDAIATQARVSFQAVDALLELARVSGEPLRTAQVDLGHLAGQVRDALQSEGALDGVDVRIASLPAVVGDEALLRQLLRNLVGNAVKFTRGHPDARVELGADPGPEFYVRDNGPGFAPEEADRIFKPFVRAAGAPSGGVGVGLSIVRRVVTRNGGWIRAEGVPGRGATFRFTLPGARAGSA